MPFPGAGEYHKPTTQQNNNQVDYAVQQGVQELERALADAQPQFREQAEYADRAARQAMDNSALYAQARGDNGGIGQAQYNEIQATRAQNHLAVQEAQTKLSTDVSRQIADLRSQGEFEKADAALELAQKYLTELMSLEKWGAQFGLNVAQFNESVRQWEAEFQLALQQFQAGQSRWEAEFNAGQSQWQQEFDYTQSYNQQKQLASMGEALLSAGIMPSEAQLSAMGMTSLQASAYLAAQQAANYKGGGTGSGGGEVVGTGYDALFAAAMADSYPKSFIYNNYKKYGFNSSTGLVEAYEKWVLSGDWKAHLSADKQLMSEAVWLSWKKKYEEEGFGPAAVAKHNSYAEYKQAWYEWFRNEGYRH